MLKRNSAWAAALLLAPSLLWSSPDSRLMEIKDAAQAAGFLVPAELKPLPAFPEPVVVSQQRDREEIQAYEDGDWTFESDARKAMDETKAALAGAGFSVVSGQVLKRAEFPWPYFYRIEFVAPYGHRYEFKTHQQGDWTFESEARTAMEEAKRGFTNAGYVLVSGTVLKRPDYPWHYYYKIVYLVRHSHPQPPPADDIQAYQGGPYKSEEQARSAMGRSMAGLERTGYVVLKADVYRIPWPKSYFFRIEYMRRHGPPGPTYPYPRPRDR